MFAASTLPHHEMKFLPLIFSIAVFLLFNQSKAAGKDESDCPICLRIVRTIRDISKSQGISITKAFDNYCKMQGLEVEEQKFCYNVESFQKEVIRLMDLNADEFRVCKKVKSINPDFCATRVTPKAADNESLRQNSKRGIIYI